MGGGFARCSPQSPRWARWRLSLRPVTGIAPYTSSHLTLLANRYYLPCCLSTTSEAPDWMFSLRDRTLRELSSRHETAHNPMLRANCSAPWPFSLSMAKPRGRRQCKSGELAEKQRGRKAEPEKNIPNTKREDRVRGRLLGCEASPNVTVQCIRQSAAILASHAAKARRRVRCTKSCGAD